MLPVPSNPSQKRILVLYFSQTGTVKRGIETLLESVDAAGHSITYVPLEPSQPLPFPWGFFPFFGIFPETVLGPTMDILPPRLPLESKYDLIILGVPIWFLSPAQPIQSFLQSSEAVILNQCPILPFISCRELWVEGFKGLEEKMGTRHAPMLNPIVIKEPLSSWKSYLSTPLFLITGHRIFTPDQRHEEQMHSLRTIGISLSHSLTESALPLIPFPRIESQSKAFEAFGKASFRLWAKWIRCFSPPKTLRRSFAICLFFLYLLAAIPLLKWWAWADRLLESDLPLELQSP